MPARDHRGAVGVDMLPEVPQRRGRVLRASTARTARPLHPELGEESFD